MRIEQLVTPTGYLFVGIAEIRNERNLTKKELLRIALNASDRAMVVQLLNASMIVDAQHLLSAAQNAVNAWYGGYAQARTLDIEIAVFASGQKQIGRALEIFGVADGLESIAVVIVDDTKENVRNCSLLMQNGIGSISENQFPATENRLKNIMLHFEIPALELQAMIESNDLPSKQEALSKCVASRVSSVALES